MWLSLYNTYFNGVVVYIGLLVSKVDKSVGYVVSTMVKLVAREVKSIGYVITRVTRSVKQVVCIIVGLVG
jgi:hypothetical protein